MNNMNDIDEKEELTWSEYICERSKQLFGTDDLNDDRVLEFVVFNTNRDKKTVHVELYDLVGFEQWEVLVNDEENKDWNLCIFVAETKEECEQWIKDNNLAVEVIE